MSTSDARFTGEIFRRDNRMIIAKNRHLASIMPVTLKYRSTDYISGTVLARNSSTGVYEAYTNGGASGTGTAVGVLLGDVAVEDFASTGATVTAKCITKGELYEAALTGLDSGAKTNMAGRSVIDAAGTTIFQF